MQAGIVKFIACFLVLVVTAMPLLAETNAAMMSTSGRVVLNGSATTKSAALFNGDRVQTASDSAVTITSAGSSVLVPPKSDVVFRGKVVEVGTGSAVVNTTNGMAARVEKITIAPAQGAAKFEVTKAQGKVLIAALKGAVTVSDGRTTSMLPEGSREVSEAAPEPQAQGGAGAAGAGAGGGAAAAGSGLATVSTLVAVGIGVAVGVTSAVIAGTTAKDVSPSRP